MGGAGTSPSARLTRAFRILWTLGGEAGTTGEAPTAQLGGGLLRYNVDRPAPKWVRGGTP
jgi:hypothetical protein